jgi:tRNA (mo5U34)-methyltransferase
MMDFTALFDQLRKAGFQQWVSDLKAQQKGWYLQHGDYLRWSEALSQLPKIDNVRGYFDRDAITVEGDCEDQQLLQYCLKGLMPWRKGPYQFAGILIDSEWRSELKWQRVLPHLTRLENRRVLDIGCGNGYHCWRMLDQSPDLVLGIEPSVLFNMQFQAVQKYMQRTEIHLLPLGIEDMPTNMCWFDTVFSMGVFYHRKSPIDHLYQLLGLLAPGGELCLETLVIDGSDGDVLVPRDRYARMNNIWFLPSPEELAKWLTRCGFEGVKIVDITATTTDEQRSTEWMQFESLSKCLDQKNKNQTVEGLPAPKRAVLVATKPGS